MNGEITYRGILHNSHNLVWILNGEGTFVLFNKRAEEVSGYRSQDWAGRSFAPLIYPQEDLPRIQKIFTAVMEGQLLQYEVTVTKANGELLYLLVNASPIYDSNGRIVGAVNFGQDVTGQERMETSLKQYQHHLEQLLTKHELEPNESNERLRYEIVERTKAKEKEQKSKERFRSLLESTSAWVWELDTNVTYTYASAKVTDILGYSPDEVLGKRPFDFMPPDEARRVEAEYSALAKNHLPFQGLENRNIRKDGRLVVIETNGVPIFDTQGIFCGYRGIDRDITARKAVDELKDQFLSMVSHELRTPLTVILGGLSTLLTDGRRLSRREWRLLTRDAYLEAKRLSSILDNLLQLTRARAGRLILREQPINVAVLLRELVREERERYPEHHFTMRCPRSASVKTDRVCLERVVTNLLDNAAKYSPEGSTVSVKVEVRDTSIVFGVSDQGEGISLEKQAKLFSLFERLGRESLSGDRGTGIGLVVCKLLVQASGGKIWLDSEVGKGSTFYFSLPLASHVLD